MIELQPQVNPTCDIVNNIENFDNSYFNFSKRINKENNVILLKFNKVKINYYMNNQNSHRMHDENIFILNKIVKDYPF